MDTTIARIKEQILNACSFMLDENAFTLAAVEEQASNKREEITTRCKRMEQSGFFSDSELSELCGYAEKIFAKSASIALGMDYAGYYTIGLHHLICRCSCVSPPQPHGK